MINTSAHVCRAFVSLPSLVSFLLLLCFIHYIDAHVQYATHARTQAQTHACTLRYTCMHTSAGDGAANLPSLMSFLMQLGFMHVGRPYALESLNSMEAVVASHMMHLGLLFPFEVRRPLMVCASQKSVHRTYWHNRHIATWCIWASCSPLRYAGLLGCVLLKRVCIAHTEIDTLSPGLPVSFLGA